MPTVNIKLSDLLKLSGCYVSAAELAEVLEQVKVEVKSVSGDDVVVEITSDRPDMFSVEGIARQLRAFMKLQSGGFGYTTVRSPPEFKVLVDSSVKKVRPYVMCGAVVGCNLGDEGFRQLIQLQEVLHKTHGRNRRKFAIGIHNLDVVKPPINYVAKPFRDFSFKPLDSEEEMTGEEILERTSKGVEYGWIIKGSGLAPLLIDDKGDVLSMPPIINADLTKVGPDTTNILIDVTGTNLKAVEEALVILATSLAERGGKIVQFVVIDGDDSRLVPNLTPQRMRVRLKSLIEVTGLDVSMDDAIKCLRKAGLDAYEVNDGLEVVIPPYRVDIIEEVDVAEELAIGYGYANIKPLIPPVTTRGGELEMTVFSKLCRDLMVGFGYQEVISYMFTSDKQLDIALAPKGRVKVLKPVSSDYTCLRTSLIPPLLSFLSENTHVEYPQRIFEVGDIALLDEKPEVKSVFERRMAALYADHRVSYEDIQAVLYSFLRVLGVNFTAKPGLVELMIKGRCGIIEVNGVQVGYLGEVRPDVLLSFGLQIPVAAFEVSLTKLLEAKGRKH
ncbi:MAG: phenylalanine--tRNA ligase subunit beta [Thermoprotei archaeon]|nr:MAG: phenylalanine--tRNA ligase subunit beta [Thermoprotei archaeon]